MTITSETTLSSFNFWSGGQTNAEQLTTTELGALESQLEDLYPNGMTDTELNDLMWFDFDSVCEWLGLDADEVSER